MHFNKLLETQVKKYLGNDCLQQEAMMHFINAVNNSYTTYEKDQALSSHAFKISEKEYAAIYQRLKDENNLKKEGNKNLQKSIGNVEDEDENSITVNINEDNLPDTIAFLNEQISKRKKS